MPPGGDDGKDAGGCAGGEDDGGLPCSPADGPDSTEPACDAAAGTTSASPATISVLDGSRLATCEMISHKPVMVSATSRISCQAV